MTVVIVSAVVFVVAAAASILVLVLGWPSIVRWGTARRTPIAPAPLFLAGFLGGVAGLALMFFFFFLFQ